MRTAPFASYCDRYENVRLERDSEGVLVVTLHAADESVAWTADVADQLASVWDHVARDPSNRAIVLTGAGDSFLRRADTDDQFDLTDAAEMRHHFSVARRLILGVLDIDVPVIAAVNGDVMVHIEQALLCDVLIAGVQSRFRIREHTDRGVPPSDGLPIILPWTLGFSRARALLVTGGEFTAEEALTWGVAAEVVPRGAVLTRSLELAAQIAKQPDESIRLSRSQTLNPLKRALVDGMAADLPAVALAHSFNPIPPGKFS